MALKFLLRGWIYFCLFAFLAGLLPASPALARYMRPDLVKIPIERLIANLEKAVSEDPKNVSALVNLARVHGMAYSSKADTTQVWRNKEDQGVWFGYEPPFVPFRNVQATEDPDKLKEAKKHLAKALERYRQAIKQAPDNLPAQLGYAWVLDQAGKKEEAIKAYRKVIDLAWAKEKDMNALLLGGHTIAGEAIGYLLPFLDKAKDREEISTLNGRQRQLQALPRPITPLVVPLRDGLRARDLEDRTAMVAFDADGTGQKRRWTWITPDAAWLVYDPQARGKPTSALEWFGNVSFWLFWENGYQALKTLDDNRDGLLQGRELEGLALWHDRNGNGVCDPGEVRPLAAWDIVGLSYQYQCDSSHPDRILFAPRGAIFRNGTVRPTFDILLHPRERN